MNIVRQALSQLSNRYSGCANSASTRIAPQNGDGKSIYSAQPPQAFSFSTKLEEQRMDLKILIEYGLKAITPYGTIVLFRDSKNGLFLYEI